MNTYGTILVGVFVVATLALTGCKDNNKIEGKYEKLFETLPPWCEEECTGPELAERFSEVPSEVLPTVENRCLLGWAFRYNGAASIKHYSRGDCHQQDPETNDCLWWSYTSESHTEVDAETLLAYDQCVYDAGVSPGPNDIDMELGVERYRGSKSACAAATRCADIFAVDDLVNFGWSEDAGCQKAFLHNAQFYSSLSGSTWPFPPNSEKGNLIGPLPLWDPS